MKKLLEIYSNIKLSKLKKGESQANRGSTLPTRGKADRFTFISWGVTVLIVISMLFSALWWKSTQSVKCLSSGSHRGSRRESAEGGVTSSNVYWERDICH